MVDDLSKYIKGGKDSEHQILREAQRLGKPKARKIKDYFNEFGRRRRYEKERRRRRKTTINKSSTRGNVLTRLTLGTLISVKLSLCWWYNRMVIQTTSTKNDISEMHPEMYDLKGQCHSRRNHCFDLKIKF